MITKPPEEIMRSPNESVFAYLNGKSAHSDIGSALWNSIKDLPYVSGYCSDLQNYGYVVVCINGAVFGFAEGMRGVTFRLPNQIAVDTIARGAEVRSVVGSEWVFFKLFGNDGFETELAALAREACAYSALLTNKLLNPKPHSGAA